MAQLLRFGTVGSIGFAVDVCVLLLLVQLLSIAPLLARILSFVVAASVTFSLNQQFTFRMRERFSLQRWSHYLLITAIGACINVGIYRLWILYNGNESLQLVVGTAIGSLVAMSINYLVSSLWLFPQHKRSPVSIK